MKVGVIGGGSLGTALVKTLLDFKRDDIWWWIYEKKISDHIGIYKRNPYYLRAIEIDIEKSRMSNRINDIIKNVEVIIISVPSLFIRESFQDVSSSDLSGKIIISTTKGLIAHGHQTVSEYFTRTFGFPDRDFVFISGPAHAEEIATKKSTYLTWVSTDPDKAKYAETLFGGSFLKIRTSEDLMGLQYTSVLKNIYAIASGICYGIGYGDNFISVVMANAIKEIGYFLQHECPAQRTINSSPYIGDVMVTAFSNFSRNRTFGELIGRGYSPKMALLELNMIPEGYYSLRSMSRIVEAKKYEMPVLNAVYRILYKQSLAEDEITKLEQHLF